MEGQLMYLNMPYKNYSQVRDAIGKKELAVRIAKNRSSELCSLVENGKVGIAAGFLLQLILPAACIIVYGATVKSWLPLPALLLYCLLPFLFPLNGFVSAAMTVVGLLGLVGGWNALVVAILLPGIFYSGGKTAWWFFIQLGLVKDIMAGRSQFEKLWKQKLFALQDRDGIYQYGGLDGDRGGRT